MTPEEEKRLVQELWEHRDDPDEWEHEPVDFLVSSNPGVVYSIRFTAAEFHQISELAERERVSIEELIKSALLKSAEPPVAKPKRGRRKVRA